jgi:hypothetical protein
MSHPHSLPLSPQRWRAALPLATLAARWVAELVEMPPQAQPPQPQPPKVAVAQRAAPQAAAWAVLPLVLLVKAVRAVAQAGARLVALLVLAALLLLELLLARLRLLLVMAFPAVHSADQARAAAVWAHRADLLADPLAPKVAASQAASRRRVAAL